MRLMHLGLKAYVVWEAITPSIGEGDLLIVNCGCTRFGRDVADLAKRAGATVALITAYPESEIGKLADVVLNLPAQLHEGGEKGSLSPFSRWLPYLNRVSLLSLT